jgi:LacI family transcriptional regulator
MSTMRQVAAAAGVSQKTVSRVFNDDPHVLPETRARVHAAMRELDYTPNSLATTFRAGRAPVIGVAVPDVVDPFFGAIARAVDATAAKHDMSALVTSIGDDPDREPSIVDSLLRRAPSGLVLASVRPEQTYLKPWVQKLPIVFVDRAPSGLTVDSFIDDDVGGARIATLDLVSHGHRRIAFFGDHLSLPTTAGRLSGYREALVRSGLEPDEELVALHVTDRASAAHQMNRLMGLAQPPTAVFSSNGRVSMALVPVLRALPVDIVSFGDFPLADVLTTPLTTIDQDPVQVGTLAAERVLDRINFPQRRFKRSTVLKVSLLERESCHRHVPAAVSRRRSSTRATR